MLRLEDVENKKEVLQDFFVWLFNDSRIIDKSIVLSSEVDLSLCPHYLDSNIYYPEQIKNFFETTAMKRLGHISQLGLAINKSPNLYHSRLEHSKGVYNKKLEEFFYNFQNPTWRKSIEDNNQKLYLIAELIKIAGHDIGHPPLSHAFEEHILGKRGAHEDIGKRIMLEDSEIQSVLLSISPCLNSIMNDLFNNDVLNFNQHDESNYDVDRLDYLLRDSLYCGSIINLPIQSYETVSIQTDSNDRPIYNQDYSISESTSGNNYIDVYDYSSLSEIENLLELRKNRYKEIYLSPNTQIYESCINNFFEAFLTSDSNVGIELKNFLLQFKNGSIKDIDLDSYIDWDEIKLYSELLDIAENHEDANIRSLATMIIPTMNSFLNLIYSHLNVHVQTHQYSDFEKSFLKKLKELISSNNELSINLRDKQYVKNNTLLLSGEPILLKNSEKDLTNKQSFSKHTYKLSEPIYIRDASGKIFELSRHPDRKFDWENEYISIDLNFSYIPYLKFNGISDEIINQLKKSNNINLNDSNMSISKANVNLQHLQVGHNIEDRFLEL